MLAVIAARTYRDYPALDRSGDRRAAARTALTACPAIWRAILLADLNWQLQNGLNYLHASSGRSRTRRSPTSRLYAPALVRDNITIGR